MTLQHINRRGETYFAFAGTTKTGKPKYFASKKPDNDHAERIDALPSEFEFHELPTKATVVIRRRRKSKVTVAERNLLQRLCLEYCECPSEVDILGDSLIVYTQDTQSKTGKDDYDAPIQSGHLFDPELRFVLQDEKRRVYSAERFCYRGAVDGWLKLPGRDAELDTLAKNLLPHLGHESFFELF